MINNQNVAEKENYATKSAMKLSVCDPHFGAANGPKIFNSPSKSATLCSQRSHNTPIVR